MDIEHHNNSNSIDWIVKLSFVANDQQSGYQKDFVAHNVTKDRAIVLALIEHMNEQYPLRGIAAYQCTFTC